MAVKGFGFPRRHSTVMRIQKGREYPGYRKPFLSSGARVCVITEISTWVQCRPNGLANSDAGLYGGSCIRDGRGPFILQRYRISSLEAKRAHSSRQRNAEPLDQDSLSKCSKEHVVHDVNDCGLLPPVTVRKLGVLRWESRSYVFP